MVFSNAGHLNPVVLQINNLTVSYEHQPAVYKLTATVVQGEWLAVVGPNGAGKSTLLNVMAGSITDYDGCIEGLRTESIAYMPQQTQLDRTFPITVFDLVATGLWQELGFFRSLSAGQHEKIKHALSAVGLQDFGQRLIGTLSGGQLQRSLFARVFLQDQPIILLDEPFNAIDTRTSADLTRVIKRWHCNNRTVIMVTHDLDYVRQHCPSTLLLARECVGHGTTEDVLTEENLLQARRACEAFDERASRCLA